MTQASDRFGTIAGNYVGSEVHRDSPTLGMLRDSLPSGWRGRICDVACGAGHTAFALADRAELLVAVDPAAPMLAACTALAAERRIDVRTVEAFAEDLPFASGSFDLVTSRLAPHHFYDIEKALEEFARILSPGGRVAIIDLHGHEAASLDGLNHQLEVLHDPTHVRSYTVSRWRTLLRDAGLSIDVCRENLTEKADGVPVLRWCEIAGTSPGATEAILALLQSTEPAHLEAIGVRRDLGGVWRMPVRTTFIVGRKPDAA